MDAISKGISAVEDTTRIISRLERVTKDFSVSGAVKDSVFLIAVLIILAFILHLIISSIQLWIVKRAVRKNPDQNNVWKLYKILGRLGIGINNHPKSWGEYRNLFYKVNNSSAIPPEIKMKLKARLEKKGLFLNNTRIINNYVDPYLNTQEKKSEKEEVTANPKSTVK